MPNIGEYCPFSIEKAYKYITLKPCIQYFAVMWIFYCAFLEESGSLHFSYSYDHLILTASPVL